MTRQRAKLDKLLQVLDGRGPVLVVTHDNPDPDALASAAGLQALFRQKAGVKALIAYGGEIGRAENRALVERLGLDVVPVNQVVLEDYPVIAIVDFQHNAGNHSLPRGLIPAIVIDHHPPLKGSRRVPFYDLRRKVGATCTIVAQYLFEAEIEPTSDLATALVYGIKSETRDLARETSPLDIETYVRLYPRADKRLLASIEMAPVGPEYFNLLVSAITKARIYGDRLIATVLGPIANADVVAEMADLFLRLHGLRCIVVIGRFEGRLIVSIRTLSHDDNAGEIIQQVFGERGSAGGHAQMAAGQLPVPEGTAAAFQAAERELVRGFRRAFDATAGPGRPLVKVE